MRVTTFSRSSLPLLVESSSCSHFARRSVEVEPKTTFYMRGIHDGEAFQGDFNFTLASNVWPQPGIEDGVRSRGIVATVIRTLSHLIATAVGA